MQLGVVGAPQMAEEMNESVMVESRLWCWGRRAACGPSPAEDHVGAEPTAGKGGPRAACWGSMAPFICFLAHRVA